MLKRLVLILAIAAVILPDTAFAVERAGKWDMGLYLASADPKDKDYEPGFYWGGNAAYGVNEWLAIGVEAGHVQFDADGTTLGTATGGDLDVTPLLADILLRAPLTDTIHVYGILGLGVLFVDYDDIRGSAAGIPFVIDTDADNAFAVKVGGGVEGFISDNWITYFEASYTFANTDVDTTTSAAGLSLANQFNDVELDYWQIGGGVKYLFN